MGVAGSRLPAGVVAASATGLAGDGLRAVCERTAKTPSKTTVMHAQASPPSVPRSPMPSAMTPMGYETMEFTPNAIIVTAITRPR
ncbi:hypothetical protein [Candidatus Amarobacter glycogenicus]|uniref:hypothetical protein n=1 Tax=Candidatus Amarobacter glycogenicus TaxID=3140699 RepID=UPI002A185CFE|nr:hypothetical protein [Dehalococcoidia bacterium]